MSVVLSVEEVGPCRRQVRIEVPMPSVEAETARVLGDYGKRARIPGFRKGKVPATLVRRHFGKEIDQEVLERLVPRYWRQAAAEKGIDALLPPRVGDVDLAAGKPLTFTAIVEVRPEIELRNTTDFELPSPPVEATPEEIRSALDDLRRGHAGLWLIRTSFSNRPGAEQTSNVAKAQEKVCAFVCDTSSRQPILRTEPLFRERHG